MQEQDPKNHIHDEAQPQDQKPIEIVTEDGELVLKQFTPDDANDIYNLISRNREFLSQYGEETGIKYPNLESVTESIINPVNPKRLRFGIRTKANEFVGSINFTSFEEPYERIGEVGYYLGQEYTGKGYMSRALIALSSFILENYEIDTIHGVINSKNTPSGKVLESAGYNRINDNLYIHSKPEIKE